MSFKSVKWEGREEVRVNLDLIKCSAEEFRKLSELTAKSDAAMITSALSRLMLHRRKASVSEATMPAFIEDVVSDLMAHTPSVLGLSIAIRTLRQNGQDDWFPSTREIIQHFKEAESHVKLAIRNYERHAAGEPQLSIRGAIMV